MIGVDTHDGDLTRVELTWVEGKTEYWIRFGHATGEQILDRNRRVVFFHPGTVFAFVRWAANDYGTISSRIDIVRAIGRGDTDVALGCIDAPTGLRLERHIWVGDKGDYYDIADGLPQDAQQ